MTSPLPHQPQDTDQLLKTMADQYGYDFRDYAPASLNRRIRQHVEQHRFQNIGALNQAITDDTQAFANLLRSLSVPVTEMFRDPLFFHYLREQIIPWLATFPFIRIWHAGCATGEEAWSMAILLQQAGLLDRTQIYATDYNEEALATARSGIYSSGLLSLWERNYQDSGCTGKLADYCLQKYRSLRMSRELQKSIIFANHNLVTDSVFGEMHLILCRNVLIYFNRHLQDRVLKLFRESLHAGGRLCLGPRESMRFSSTAGDFDTLHDEWRVFRRKGGSQ
ncbi:CheR family methyltransferase [Parendozoicomonas haliclonae]|uniref:Chemotaxis protein methyltransferase n=1 Tax=Parendozoicomonas haliclonae TaxID=1960125 RepID=A0A1X7ALF6_9GAMM|nr:protein-glutamate O-methyltransferase CheR [Parendozoicomonas haliclonae]SMA48738.1 Chemotaxis protein methyltransferase [Parendozoicomonas haliclonae]